MVNRPLCAKESPHQGRRYGGKHCYSSCFLFAQWENHAISNGVFPTWVLKRSVVWSKMENQQRFLEDALWTGFWRLIIARTWKHHVLTLSADDWIKKMSQVALVVKNPPANAGDVRNTDLIPGSRKSSGGGQSNPLLYSCRKKSHGQRSLVGYSPWGCKELDMIEVT